MKIAVPDLISPSYFPAEAAVTLGFLANEGIDAQIELISPIEFRLTSSEKPAASTVVPVPAPRPTM